MSEPIVAAKSPAVVELEPGIYLWCRCGRSRNQPFCDASHAGSGLRPLEFEVEEKGRMALCRCKHTAHAPRCDGTHYTLD